MASEPGALADEWAAITSSSESITPRWPTQRQLESWAAVLDACTSLLKRIPRNSNSEDLKSEVEQLKKDATDATDRLERKLLQEQQLQEQREERQLQLRQLQLQEQQLQEQREARQFQEQQLQEQREERQFQQQREERQLQLFQLQLQLAKEKQLEQEREQAGQEEPIVPEARHLPRRVQRWVYQRVQNLTENEKKLAINTVDPVEYAWVDEGEEGKAAGASEAQGEGTNEEQGQGEGTNASEAQGEGTNEEQGGRYSAAACCEALAVFTNNTYGQPEATIVKNIMGDFDRELCAQPFFRGADLTDLSFSKLEYNPSALPFIDRRGNSPCRIDAALLVPMTGSLNTKLDGDEGGRRCERCTREWVAAQGRDVQLAHLHNFAKLTFLPIVAVEVKVDFHKGGVDRIRLPTVIAAAIRTVGAAVREEMNRMAQEQEKLQEWDQAARLEQLEQLEQLRADQQLLLDQFKQCKIVGLFVANDMRQAFVASPNFDFDGGAAGASADPVDSLRAGFIVNVQPMPVAMPAQWTQMLRWTRHLVVESRNLVARLSTVPAVSDIEAVVLSSSSKRSAPAPASGGGGASDQSGSDEPGKAQKTGRRTSASQKQKPGAPPVDVLRQLHAWGLGDYIFEFVRKNGHGTHIYVCGTSQILLVKFGDQADVERELAVNRAVRQSPYVMISMHEAVLRVGDRPALVMVQRLLWSWKYHAGRGCLRGAQDLLRALRDLHAAGWVHRDVKPDNVLGGGIGLLLTDFGLALRPSQLTASGAGTRGFIAPELRDPSREVGDSFVPAAFDVLCSSCVEPHTLGPAADLWSLGATLLCMFEQELLPLPPPGSLAAEGLTSASTARELVAVLLDPCPARRGTAEGLLRRLSGAAARKRPAEELSDPVNSANYSAAAVAVQPLSCPAPVANRVRARQLVETKE